MFYEDEYIDADDAEDYNLLVDDPDRLDEEFTDAELGPMLDGGPRNLVAHDYTLDSPLIRDEMDGFLAYYKDRPYQAIHQRRIWPVRKQWIEELVKPGADLNGTGEFHGWFSYLLHRPIPTAEFSDFVDLVNADARQTHPVLQAFLQNWIGEDFPFMARDNIDATTLRYGAIHMRLHILTLAINCSTLAEGAHIASIADGDVSGEDRSVRLSFNFEGWGRIEVGAEYVWFQVGNQLLDRNMLLMAKDVAGGRFQTLLHSQYKADPPYPRNHYGLVDRVFTAGDGLLEKYGSKAYSAIKLVEPTALDQMDQIAARLTPAIPQATNYSQHMKVAVQKANEELPGSQDLFDLIYGVEEVEILATIFGAFRLWGHPFIDYTTGLAKLYENVTIPKEIDTAYAEQLASDFAFKVLRSQFQKTRTWFVDPSRVPMDHPLKDCIQQGTWPSAARIQAVGDIWHKLPLIPCFDIPDYIDPTIIYADKHHSMNRSEVINHIETRPGEPIPSRSVLETYIATEPTNWKEFLQQINDKGLDPEQLVIALRAKEREIKEMGRFFAMMSWQLREFFVVTEHLIKTHYVPLFHGLTMADDHNTVIEKMLAASDSQNPEDPHQVNYANHLDYSKWNNHQRGEANDPVFRVMGQFLGLPDLFTRTHEFFKKSLIYYKDRPDLMRVVNGKVVNATDQIVCWEGQAGGLEGLRQKGWSVVNYLGIERQARIRNTHIKCLAQGDNQIICTFYKVRSSRSPAELTSHLADAKRNNDIIMESIRVGAEKLGLVINEDETLQSSSMIVYGKVIIYHGLIIPLIEKRLGRLLCTTNDQLPTIGSICSTVVTNLLTVAHFSDTPINAMLQYNWLGNYARRISELHNPALRCPTRCAIPDPSILDQTFYKLNFLFLDPSLGGVGGISLTRFLMRQFPDPVTESLAFWKIIHDANISAEINETALAAGNPRLAVYRPAHFGKLLENPSGLNLPRGVSVVSVLRTRIRRVLIQGRGNIRNHAVSTALDHVDRGEETLVDFLASINPCFPRFVSEFYSATYIGTVSSLIGLFENSRTIRRNLLRHLGSDIDNIIVRAERSSISSLAVYNKGRPGLQIWRCSSSHADFLREKSWDRKLVGATIPHPIELLGPRTRVRGSCRLCESPELTGDCVTVAVPTPFPPDRTKRGPYRPYLGSKTAETTSIIQPWEKTTKVPLIRRCVALRKTIAWFVAPDSKLAVAILSNIKALTGEEAAGVVAGFRRTGSALHRFCCARQSNGGFSGASPNLASYVIMTTDTLERIEGINFDFMHQSVLILCQVTTIAAHRNSKTGATYHYHIRCLDCLRPIDEPTLDTTIEYKFDDVSAILASWKPQGTVWFDERPVLELEEGDWGRILGREQSFHIGRILGFYYGDQGRVAGRDIPDIFPVVLSKKLRSADFLQGIADGVYRAAAISLLHRRAAMKGYHHISAFQGNYLSIIDSLSHDPGFLMLMSSPQMFREVNRTPHRIPASYPVAQEELAGIVRAHFHMIFSDRINRPSSKLEVPATVWVFADFLSANIAGPLALSTKVVETFSKPRLSASDLTFLRGAANTDTLIRGKTLTRDLLLEVIRGTRVYMCPMEVRSACRDIQGEEEPESGDPEEEFGEEFVGTIRSHVALFSSNQTPIPIMPVVPDIRDPTCSGLRIPQIATGSYLKCIAICKGLGIRPRDILCGGDGSGGWSSALLRQYPTARVIFNSLFSGEGLSLRGSCPAPPHAIAQMPTWISERCVNLKNCWEHPSDLGDPETWEYFMSLKRSHRLRVDLITLDMQLVSLDKNSQILANMLGIGMEILEKTGTLIYKAYLGALHQDRGVTLGMLGSVFWRVSVVQTELSGSFTSEVYLVCERQRVSRTGKLYVSWDGWIEGIKGFFCFEGKCDFSINQLYFFYLCPFSMITNELS